jgi:hypothetical protein
MSELETPVVVRRSRLSCWGPRVSALTLLLVCVTACGSSKSSSTEQSLDNSTTTSLLIQDGQPNSCGIFTVAEVKSFMGDDVAAGTNTGAGQGCYYAASNGRSAFLINLQPNDSRAKFADGKALASQQTTDVQTVEGVGDEAFTYSPREGGIASAEARKGSVRVRIVITGPQASVVMAKTALVSAVAKTPA